MTTDYTILPQRTDYSLGRVKSDPESAIALDYQVAAAEWETAADWVKENSRLLGAEGSIATGSAGTIRGIVRRLGYGDPLKHRWLDHFEYRGAANTFDPRWNMAGSTVCLDVPGGVVAFPQDLAVAENNYQHGRIYEIAQGPAIETRMRMDDVGASAPIVRVGFINSVGTADGFGITFERGVSLKWQVFSLQAGAFVRAEIGSADVLANTWYVLRVWIVKIGGSYYARASVDDANETTEATNALSNVPLTPWTHTGVGAVAGKQWGCDYTWVEAEFGV